MIIDLILMIVIFYLALYCICSRAAVEEANSRRFISIVLIPNHGENKPEDDLPPYTPPTPKTQAAMTAAMTDLPPSYEETMDISEVRIPIHNTNNNNDSNTSSNSNTSANSNTSSNSNNSTPITSVASPNSTNVPTVNVNVNSNSNAIPEIVIDPTNTPNTTVS